MDIEGGEYHAFIGMDGLLRRSSVVAFEINRFYLQDTWGPFRSLLAEVATDAGKSFYLPDPNGQPVSTSLAQLEDPGGSPHVLLM
jgi:hypothetical protein